MARKKVTKLYRAEFKYHHSDSDILFLTEDQVGDLEGTFDTDVWFWRFEDNNKVVYVNLKEVASLTIEEE